MFGRMLAHARAEFPRECVGMLLGLGERVTRVVELQNVSNEAELSYEVDPIELLRALRKADEENLEVLAVYHSHPGGSLSPSATDVEKATWRAIYVIIAPEAGEARAYRLPEGEEVVLVVE